jgi:membrane-associated protease RseP (regulator of RpoE activity)
MPDLAASDWALIAVVSVCAYSIALMPLKNSEFWKSHGITTWGPVPVVFFRTTRGLKLLDALSRPKTFWRIIASAGIPLVIASMAYFLTILLLMSYIMIREPPEPSSYNAPRNILLIPGVNEYIPLVWGWIALFVTMFVHEFAHGILARVEGIRVKSMGLAFLLFPIAAFVEPDEEELFGTNEKKALASRSARIRILAAGVISNFIVAIVAMALFFGPVIGAISPVDRVVVSDVQNQSLGDEAGFQNGMIILGSNGQEVGNLSQLYSALNSSRDSAALSVSDGGQSQVLELEGAPIRGILITTIFEDSAAQRAGMPGMTVVSGLDNVSISGIEDFRDYMNLTKGGQSLLVKTSNGTYNLLLEDKDGKGYMGIGISGDAVYMGGVIFQDFPAEQFLGLMKVIPKSGISGFMTLMGLPFTGIPGVTEKGFPGFSGWISNFFQPSGWAEPLGGKFFWIANLLLWIGWINLYAGLFNCLPAVPLDGGHIFRDLVQSGLEKLFGAQNAEKLTGTVVALLAWLVLTSIVITVVAPYMAHGLPS